MAILYDADFFKHPKLVLETYVPERGKSAGKNPDGTPKTSQRIKVDSLKTLVEEIFKGDKDALLKLCNGALTAKYNAAQSDPDQKFTMPAKRFLQINYFKDVLGVDITAANPEEPTKEEVCKAIEYLKNPPKAA